MTALALTAANLDGTVVPGVSYDGVLLGANMTAGLVVYKDSSNLLQVSTITNTTTAQALGLYSQTSANAGQPTAPIWGNGTIVTAFPTLVAGTVYYLGSTGTIVPFADLTTGNIMTIVGYAYSTSSFMVNIIMTGLAKA